MPSFPQKLIAIETHCFTKRCYNCRIKNTIENNELCGLGQLYKLIDDLYDKVETNGVN